MERRTFIKLGSSICASGALGLPQLICAEETSVTQQAMSIGDKTRLTPNALSSIGIEYPVQLMSPPSGKDVLVTMPPRVVRGYNTRIYIHFELQDYIAVYDELGGLIDKVVNADFAHGIKDFAVDEELALIYVLLRGESLVRVINFQGEVLDQIGEFGIELAEQLNGPSSLTLDANKRLHVLCTGSNMVKVYADTGAYLFAYRASFARKPRRMRSIDGFEVITITTGDRQQRKWLFTLQGKPVN